MASKLFAPDIREKIENTVVALLNGNQLIELFGD
jgi:hypothetical protein